jgi:hypothetical protein
MIIFVVHFTPVLMRYHPIRYIHNKLLLKNAEIGLLFILVIKWAIFYKGPQTISKLLTAFITNLNYFLSLRLILLLYAFSQALFKAPISLHIGIMLSILITCAFKVINIIIIIVQVSVPFYNP